MARGGVTAFAFELAATAVVFILPTCTSLSLLAGDLTHPGLAASLSRGTALLAGRGPRRARARARAAAGRFAPRCFPPGCLPCGCLSSRCPPSLCLSSGCLPSGCLPRRLGAAAL